MEKEMCQANTLKLYSKRRARGFFHSADKRDKLQYRQGIATR